MNTVLAEYLVLPDVLKSMTILAKIEAKKRERIVFLKHAVEHGFCLTLDPMPRRSWDLIGVAMPDGRVCFIEREALRLGATLGAIGSVEFEE